MQESKPDSEHLVAFLRFCSHNWEVLKYSCSLKKSLDEALMVSSSCSIAYCQHHNGPKRPSLQTFSERSTA